MKTTTKAGQNRPAGNRTARIYRAGQLVALLLFGIGKPVLMAAPAATTTTLAVTAKGLGVSSVDAGTVVSLTATV